LRGRFLSFFQSEEAMPLVVALLLWFVVVLVVLERC
jgi:hypothetical protein